MAEAGLLTGTLVLAVLSRGRSRPELLGAIVLAVLALILARWRFIA